MKNLYLIFFTLVALQLGLAQDGGLRLYAGTTTLINQDKIVNPEGQSHTGYHFGADGRLMYGTMSFIVGAKYTSVSKLPIDGFKLTGHNSSLSMMNGRVGLDYSIISFGQYFRVRTKLLASFDLTLNISSNDDPPAGYEFNDGWLGGVTGLGIDLGPIILDVEYELGILNAYRLKKGAKFNSWTVSAGVFF